VEIKNGHITSISLFDLHEENIQFDFASFPFLKEIKIIGSDLSLTPDFSRNKALESIILTRCRLKTFPLLPDLPKLHQITIQSSRPKSDSLAIPKLPSNLETLLVSYNCNNIAFSKSNRGSNLKRLILSHNQLTTVDRSISVFQNLEDLYVDGNNISTLDLSMLPNLKEVVAGQNPVKKASAIKTKAEVRFTNAYVDW
jgi:Leucine-rich repeat (LRR) protein